MTGKKLILGKDRFYDLDCYTTKLNNNVMVVGDNHIIGLSHLTFRTEKAA